MSYEMFDGDRLTHMLVDVMERIEDDLQITVTPMRRDAHWAPAVLNVYRDGIKISPDPLYAWFCWVERELVRLERRGEYDAWDRLVGACDVLVEQLDDAWEES